MHIAIVVCQWHEQSVYPNISLMSETNGIAPPTFFIKIGPNDYSKSIVDKYQFEISSFTGLVAPTINSYWT